jgi:hypothetical protein
MLLLKLPLPFCAIDIRLKAAGESDHMELISRLLKPIPVPETPGTEGVSDSEGEVTRGAVLL